MSPVGVKNDDNIKSFSDKRTRKQFYMFFLFKQEKEVDEKKHGDSSESLISTEST